MSSPDDPDRARLVEDLKFWSELRDRMVEDHPMYEDTRQRVERLEAQLRDDQPPEDARDDVDVG